MSGRPGPLSTGLLCPQCNGDLVEYLGVWGVCPNCSNTAFHLGTLANPGRLPLAPTGTTPAAHAPPRESRRHKRLHDHRDDRDVRRYSIQSPGAATETARAECPRPETQDTTCVVSLPELGAHNRAIHESLQSFWSNRQPQEPTDSAAPSPLHSQSPSPASSASATSASTRVLPHPPRFRAGQQVRIRDDEPRLPTENERDLHTRNLLARAENIENVLATQTRRLRRAIERLRFPARDGADLDQLPFRVAALERQLLETVLDVRYVTAQEALQFARP